MYSLLLPSTSGVGWKRQPAGCRRVVTHVRWMGTAHAKTMVRRPLLEGVTIERKKMSFPALGLEPKFVQALQTAFPAVEAPTEVQERLIPEVLGNKDILLKDITGSGKSFGLILGLLNKPRKVMLDERGEKKRVVTALYVVPHKDLAFQFRNWIERVTSALEPSPPLSSIVQVLVRGDGTLSREEKMAELRRTPPHVLICTPQALKEVYEEDKEALMLDTLSTVVVDEVDYLVDIDKRKKIKHNGPTVDMLNVIYGRRKELCENQYDPAEDEEGEYESVAEWRNEKEREEGIPQLILSSATLKVQFKNYLFTESGWLNSYNLVKISGEKEREEGRIQHSILVATERGVRNIEGAVKGKEIEFVPGEEEEDVGAEEERYFKPEYARTPSPFGASCMEAIATGFALDVPSTALLVVPSSAPVQRAVWELRELGVDANLLDVRRVGQRGMLVGTVGTTRGLDLADLSHVFVMSGVEEYVHVAGRVGRFGGRGRVISVVSDERQAARIHRLLTAIGEQPVLFEHFD